ncbi:glutathione S-transferase [Roseibium denhamense]|uniref:Glutathione S-transferase n=1 Tax=Roseibium denhamense TaxID=76305 RepID=A0ABY1P810_9HYPH|nr:glutathione S-transferase [Roseibium denhamense]MTI07245.1 glutathione S-transferase [Roseibium denhamense]SMP26277.1 glutathione S-transferase [Roseibium denhamense]
MAEYVLHCMAQSGHSYKVALMLNLCGADWEARWVDFFNGETRTEDFRKNLNELGEVPVLDHNGKLFTQSAVIMDYLGEVFGKFSWDNDAERREILRWTVFDNQKVSGQLGSLRFMRSLAKTGENDVTAFLDGRIRKALDILDKHFAASDFAIGAKATSADFSLCSYMYYEGEAGIDLTEYPNLTTWLERIKTLPGWDHPYNLMPGHPLPDAK